MLKLHIDFGRNSRMCRHMAHDTDDGIRAMFTEIGCIMEDASLIALVWGKADVLDIRARWERLSEANTRVTELLEQIEIGSGGA